jgi:hypothetical protein
MCAVKNKTVRRENRVKPSHNRQYYARRVGRDLQIYFLKTLRYQEEVLAVSMIMVLSVPNH